MTNFVEFIVYLLQASKVREISGDVQKMGGFANFGSFYKVNYALYEISHIDKNCSK